MILGAANRKAIMSKKCNICDTVIFLKNIWLARFVPFVVLIIIHTTTKKFFLIWLHTFVKKSNSQHPNLLILFMYLSTVVSCRFLYDFSISMLSVDEYFNQLLLNYYLFYKKSDSQCILRVWVQQSQDFVSNERYMTLHYQ